MEKYTIYCTPEQTRKALELGAHPEFVTSQNIQDSKYEYIKRNLSLSSFENTRYINVDREYGKNPKYVVFNKEVYRCPTVEQMLGWLEEQGIAVYAFVDNNEKEYTGWSYEVVKDFKNGGWKNTLAVPDITFNSYKEATLAAVDVALEYLSNKK